MGAVLGKVDFERKFAKNDKVKFTEKANQSKLSVIENIYLFYR